LGIKTVLLTIKNIRVMRKILLLLVLFGMLGLALCSCGQKEDNVVAPEEVMILYDKPVDVIQKAVQGKWEWQAAYGGAVGIQYPTDTYVEFTDSYHIISAPNREDTTYFTWKKFAVYSSAHEGGETYIAWSGEGAVLGNWYFENLRNDTLSVGIYGDGNKYIQERFGNVFVRFKGNATNSCYFNNPLTDLPWLKAFIGNKVQEAKKGYPDLVRIYQCIYNNGRIGFLIEPVGMIDGMMEFYSCEGIVLCTIGGESGKDTCLEQGLNIIGKKLIWELKLFY
jgi:hypothetical protein